MFEHIYYMRYKKIKMRTDWHNVWNSLEWSEAEWQVELMVWLISIPSLHEDYVPTQTVWSINFWHYCWFWKSRIFCLFWHHIDFNPRELINTCTHDWNIYINLQNNNLLVYYHQLILIFSDNKVLVSASVSPCSYCEYK